jgi:hypothetical protein
MINTERYHSCSTFPSIRDCLYLPYHKYFLVTINSYLRNFHLLCQRWQTLYFIIYYSWRRDPDDCWYVVGDNVSGEKVGQKFRDSFSVMFSNCTRSERRHHVMVSVRLENEVESMIIKFTSDLIEALSATILKSSKSQSELFIPKKFTAMNIKI